MRSLDEVVSYLNQAEARDKICKAIQFGSKFVSNGEPGTAQNVDRTTDLARKEFQLFRFINDFNALITPSDSKTPLTLVVLGKSKNALLSSFFFLDQFVWLGEIGIYENKEHTELIKRISLFCLLGSYVCTTLIETGELVRLSVEKKGKEAKNTSKDKNESGQTKLQKVKARSLALVRGAMDIVVAVGLLQLAPQKVTARVTGAFGFTTSLIACYQLLPSKEKEKKA